MTGHECGVRFVTNIEWKFGTNAATCLENLETGDVFRSSGVFIRQVGIGLADSNYRFEAHIDVIFNEALTSHIEDRVRARIRDRGLNNFFSQFGFTNDQDIVFVFYIHKSAKASLAQDLSHAAFKIFEVMGIGLNLLSCPRIEHELFLRSSEGKEGEWEPFASKMAGAINEYQEAGATKDVLNSNFLIRG